MTDIEARLKFIEELDKLKSVERQTRLIFEDRRENTAEHSWHVATFALVLAPYAPRDVDIERAAMMLLVHDIVEIDVGDTFAYDVEGHQDKADRESRAADRLFGIVPGAEGASMRLLWEEFERAESPTGAFAHSIDRFLPILHNFRTDGHAWKKHGIRRSQVLTRNSVIEKGCPALWPVVHDIVNEAVMEGMLLPD